MDLKHFLHQWTVAIVRAQLGLQRKTDRHNNESLDNQNTAFNEKYSECLMNAVCYLESHDEDTQRVQDSQTHFSSDVSLQQRLI